MSTVIMVRDIQDRDDDESKRTGISEVTWDTWSKSTGKPSLTTAKTCNIMDKPIVTMDETRKATSTVEKVVQLVCDTITASAQKIIQDTVDANSSKTSDATEQVALLSGSVC
jgi:hypothetical protein